MTRRRSQMLGVLGWVGLVAASAALGRLLGASIKLGAAPLAGRIELRFSAWTLVPAAAGIVVLALRRRAGTLSFAPLLAAVWGLAALWAVALALADGPAALVSPVRGRYDYLADARRIVSPLAFLRTFVDRIGTYVVHVRGHPPGITLLVWVLREPWLIAAVFIAGGALAAPAAMLAVREVAGEGWARRIWPWLVTVPAAVWITTYADALIAGLSAAGVALVVAGLYRPARAVTGGVVLGMTAQLSYGAVLGAVVAAGMVAGTVALRGRASLRERIVAAFRPLSAAAAGGAFVFAAFAWVGFWWPAGLYATRVQYYAGVAAKRPYLPFVLISLGAFAVACGPAVFAGLAALRDRRMWIVCGSGIAAVVVADLSGMSKGEVERIWLLFVPWVAAGAAEAGGLGALAAQMALGVALQAGTRW